MKTDWKLVNKPTASSNLTIRTYYLRADQIFFKKVTISNFPGGPVVKKLPCNVGDTVLIPALGTKIPHTKGQTSS